MSDETPSEAELELEFMRRQNRVYFDRLLEAHERIGETEKRLSDLTAQAQNLAGQVNHLKAHAASAENRVADLTAENRGLKERLEAVQPEPAEDS